MRNRLTSVLLFAAVVSVAWASWFSKSPAGAWRCVNYSEAWLDLRKDGTAYGYFWGNTNPSAELRWESGKDGSIILRRDGSEYTDTLTPDGADYVYRQHRFRRAEKVPAPQK